MSVALRVVADVAAGTGVSTAEILGKCRERPMVLARREAIRRLYVDRRQSTPAIAKVFGMRNHNVRHHLLVAGVKLGRG